MCVGIKFPTRTEEHAKHLVALARACTSRGQEEALCKKFSFHPVEVGLWGWAEGDTEVGSSSWVFSFESMHNEDLGVFLYIIDCMKVWSGRGGIWWGRDLVWGGPE